MSGTLIVDKNEALNDIVRELEEYSPIPTFFRVHSKGEAIELVLNKNPNTVMVEDGVEDSFQICQEIKANPYLREIHVIYFVGDHGKIKNWR